MTTLSPTRLLLLSDALGSLATPALTPDPELRRMLAAPHPPTILSALDALQRWGALWTQVQTRLSEQEIAAVQGLKTACDLVFADHQAPALLTHEQAAAITKACSGDNGRRVLPLTMDLVSLAATHLDLSLIHI
jgi:hypothetical protein